MMKRCWSVPFNMSTAPRTPSNATKRCNGCGMNPVRTNAVSSATCAACPRVWTSRRWTRCCFSGPRNSQVDVVQAVGSVMRKAEGKDYGYIILPVCVDEDKSPEEALQDDKTYKVVWQVLQALRAHDNRFNAEINRIELNKGRQGKINVIGGGFGEPTDDDDDTTGEPAPPRSTLQLPINLKDWKDALYARLVLKCGDRRYWETWAKDVAEIAGRNITRIKELVGESDADYRDIFDEFMNELRQNINPSVSEADAIEMLAQHLITRPVFDALFEGYSFIGSNPVSKTMQADAGIAG